MNRTKIIAIAVFISTALSFSGCNSYLRSKDSGQAARIYIQVSGESRGYGTGRYHRYLMSYMQKDLFSYGIKARGTPFTEETFVNRFRYTADSYSGLRYYFLTVELSTEESGRGGTVDKASYRVINAKGDVVRQGHVSAAVGTLSRRSLSLYADMISKQTIVGIVDDFGVAMTR